MLMEKVFDAMKSKIVMVKIQTWRRNAGQIPLSAILYI